MQKLFICTLILSVFIFYENQIFAQDYDYPFPSRSPKGDISQIVGNTTIEIEYERPSVRGREIFGELVPWGEVWRTGAGYATKIRFDREVKIGGQSVKAGKYSIFTIPNKESWILILNSDTELYGSYDYDPAKDVLRYPLINQNSGRFYETLTIDIDIIPDNAQIFISWANKQVSFLVETSTAKEMDKFIESQLISGKSQNADWYAAGADYYFFNGENYGVALDLASKAIELSAGNLWARSIRIDVFKRLGYFEKALDEIERYKKYVKSDSFERPNDLEQELNYLNTEKSRIEDLRKK
ncbi:DUF2911 domain-containing protein [Algoriphagus sediminis]|uniref:DUF2911 domain-containing protein n=1 Tax=Algoriphagus sediminis TaxID=3057113 RepID=A0ABT7Y9I8_9BACT|nr:DUF2911 domain-containing protein [Algoriphagus sediminis]MDN3203182.1 DUF2911 domain-containing protein [Algoriphagus sediminis]